MDKASDKKKPNEKCNTKRAHSAAARLDDIEWVHYEGRDHRSAPSGSYFLPQREHWLWASGRHPAPRKKY